MQDTQIQFEQNAGLNIGGQYLTTVD